MIVKNEMTTKQRFSAAMTTCSILSAIFVVWIQTYNVEVYGDTNRVIYWIQEIFSQGVTRGAVPFFMMSSAFFLFSKDKKVTEVYTSRSKSVLVPYLLWNFVYMVVFAVLRRLSLSGVGMDVVTVGNVAEGLFLHKYNYAYWFMRDLIVLVALYPLIRWLLRRGKAVSFLLLGGLCLAMVCDVTFLKSSVYYFIGAILGHFYSQQVQDVVNMDKKKQVILIAGLLVVSGVLFRIGYFNKWLWMAVLRDLSTAFLMFFTVIYFNVRIGGWFAALSFMIYSVHPLLLEIIEKVIYLVFPHNDLWMMVDYVVAPIVCLGLIVVICLLWKKLLPGVYKVFNGGRL